MQRELSCVLEKKFIPQMGFKEEVERPYRIEMVNDFLNILGQVYKRQELKSNYMRVIDKIYDDTVAMLSHRWLKTTFVNRRPRTLAKPIEWTFAKGMVFCSNLIFSEGKQLELWRKGIISPEDYQNCFQSMSKAYEQLPKLPATYLLIMQTFDIIAFENYLSYIHTYAESNKGWKVDERVVISPREVESSEVKIGFGLYSEDSIFKNGKFYLKLSGYGKANNKSCAVFDYYCNNARVRMQDKKRTDAQRIGTSYYHGQVWLDLNTGDLERGTMLESYIALQEGKKQKPVHIRRSVISEALSEESTKVSIK